MFHPNKTKNSKLTGNLKQSGKPYFCNTLKEKDIPAILKLQETILKTLKPEEKAFIVAKTEEGLKKVLKQNGEASLGIGVFSEGKLIGQAIILYPSEKYPDNSMVDMETVAASNKTSIISNVLVDPKYRGNNLMDLMVEHWVDMSQSLNKTDLIAEVEVNNVCSWSVFLKAGLKLHSMGKDPSDGVTVYNVHSKINSLDKKHLTVEFNKSAKKHCAANDIKTQKKLFKEGYQGVLWNKQGKQLTFYKKR